MELRGVKIGFILTGSFYSLKAVIPTIRELILKEHAEIIPIMSFNCYKLKNRYGKLKVYIKEIEDITEKKIIHNLKNAEEIGKKKIVDIMIIAPCTRKYNFKISL